MSSAVGAGRAESFEAIAQRADASLDALPTTPPIKAWMLTAPVDFVAVTVPGVLAPEHLHAFLSMGVLSLALLHSGGRYRARLHISTLDDLPSILGRAFAAAAVVASITALRHPSAGVADFLRWASLSAALLVVGRFMTNMVIRTARTRRIVQHSTVVLGAGPLGLELVRLLDRYPQYGLRVAGVVDDRDVHEAPEDTRGVIRLGRADQLDEAIRRVKADVILVADPARSDGTLLDLVRGPAASRCDLLVVPRLPDFHTQVGLADHIGAIPIMRIKSPSLLGPSRLAKRGFDLLVASLALLLASPVMLGAAIAVRLEGKGVLFRQARMTRDGRIFQVIKFRSMRPLSEEEANLLWSIADDVRVTRVGRFLRKTSIDELPQLWNILRGDMTLVGPRPERPYFVEQFSTANPRYAERHRVVCGLTGLAQVSGLRGDTSIIDRARYDNFYIENWSLWMDVKVMLRTLGEVFRAKGR